MSEHVYHLNLFNINLKLLTLCRVCIILLLVLIIVTRFKIYFEIQKYRTSDG